MSKRRSIISYDKLTIEQKKQILRDFPDGYINHLTTIKTPTGEILDALVWETDEVIYLVKINKVMPKIKPVADDDEDDFDDDFDKIPGVKDDDIDDDDSSDDEEDEYDKPEVDDEEEED
jgi:DNA-directed RNA polymerase subunit delta